MRSSVTRRFGAFSALAVAGAAVTVFHSAAFAQQEGPGKESEKGEKAAATAAPETEGKPQTQQQGLPPEYAPPPGYHRAPPQPPAPPPGPYYHDYYYGPPPYYPPPPPHYYRRVYAPPRFYPEPLSYRPFFFGVGLGVGGLAVLPHDTSQRDNSSRAGLGYSLRFGFGVSPRWSIVLAADGAQAYFDGRSVSATAWTIGPQVFITRQLYARLGVGAGTREEDACDDYGYCYGYGTSDSGIAGTGALGFEFMQSYHVALALEAVGTIARYPNEDHISTFGVNFVLNLF